MKRNDRNTNIDDDSHSVRQLPSDIGREDREHQAITQPEQLIQDPKKRDAMIVYGRKMLLWLANILAVTYSIAGIVFDFYGKTLHIPEFVPCIIAAAYGGNLISKVDVDGTLDMLKRFLKKSK